MRMPRPLISLLLAVSVLAGQWLAATHDSEHGLQPGAAHACAICVYAHAAGCGALPVAPALNFEFTAVAHECAPVVARTCAPTLHHPIRGPPQLS